MRRQSTFQLFAIRPAGGTKKYGQFVRLGEGTDFLKFLEALVHGIVYYDPAIKIESASTDAPRLKRRSQFRVKSGQLPALYASMTEVELPV